MHGIQIYDEIGRLKRVLVHKPGPETHNYAEGDFEQVFSLRKWSRRFDYDQALSEYEHLVALFEHEGVEVLTVQQLLTEALDANPQARVELTEDYSLECGARGQELLYAILAKLENEKTNRAFAQAVIEGIHYGETQLPNAQVGSLAAHMHEAFNENALLVNPLNTLFFTRDPATPIGRGALLNHLYWPERNREVSVYRCILRYHPLFPIHR